MYYGALQNLPIFAAMIIQISNFHVDHPFWGDFQPRDLRPKFSAKKRAQIPPMSQVSCLIFSLSHGGAPRDSVLI